MRPRCQVLRVAPAAYYAWQRRRQAPTAEAAWQVAVREAFACHSQCYGTRRLRAEVQAQGHAVGRWRIRRVSKGHGPEPGVGGRHHLPAPPRRRLYLAVWLDRCARKAVGWDVRDTMPEDLVSEALRRARVVRRPSARVIVHSDQGSQYLATRFKALLSRHSAQQSRSRRGNCYDKAHAESFWCRFKAELLDGGSFPGLAEAKLEISNHVAYYNAERRHSALGYRAPSHFETHLQTTSQYCLA